MAETIATQYQHFVPQFLIRNFAHPFKPPNNGRKRSQRPKRRPVNGMYPNDPVVHNLNLSEDPPVLCEAPVNRIFGQMDMYRDTNKPSAEQQHIEQMFSKLEGRASTVFRKITKSFEQKEGGLWLTRDERDLLRKFLFLLKYRGLRFYRRFYHENAEAYDANDRELVHDYMIENEYKRPIDVWLHNLKTIMELRMDPEGKWISDLPKRMLPEDAMWFITHAQGMYMAICTPSNPSDEFILTENCYNVFEGPNCFVTDAKSGKVEGTSYTALHEFAPISPKLMIVLRSSVLPVPEEDADPTIKDERESTRIMVLDSVYKEEIKSHLADLPIKKARNNYTQIVNGRLQIISQDWKQSKDDKFCFNYFPIGTAHVQIINEIFLDNAYISSRLVFETQDSFSRTLESYLTASTGKLMTGDDLDLRLALLKKLTAVSQTLGFKFTPDWKVESPHIIFDYEKFRQGLIEQGQWFRSMIKKGPKLNHDNEFTQIYKTLGGSEETLFEDTEQAGLMWKLRVKIDAWSQGVDEIIRERNRRLLIRDYLRLPPRRVWFFVKHMRIMFLQGSENAQFDWPYLSKEGPEDIIAQGKYPLSSLPYHIIESSKLRQLMYRAVINEFKMKGVLGSMIWAGISNPNLSPFERFEAIGLLFSLEHGYIRDCGINEIEQLAGNQEQEILRRGQKSRETLRYPMLKDSEIIELLTRTAVRSQFVDALSGKLEESSLKALEAVFFEILYPTPA